MTWRRWVLASACFLGCATPSPTPPPEAYARALDANRLEQAYALTTPSYRTRVSPGEFQARYADPEARRARALAIRDSLAELARTAPELFGEDAGEGPEAVMLRFATAIRAGHFDEGWHCLSAELRKRYSVEALSRDFRAEPGAAGRLERAVLAAEGTPVKEGDVVRFPLAGGGAVLVLHESDGWKLAALE